MKRPFEPHGSTDIQGTPVAFHTPIARCASHIFNCTLLYLVSLPLVVLLFGFHTDFHAIDPTTVEREMLGFNDELLPWSSDMVMVYQLVADLLKGVDSLRDWYYSPALYAFPDWLMTAPLVLLPVPSSYLPWLFAAGLLTGYCLAGAALVASVTGSSAKTLAWLLLLVLILAAAITLLVPGRILGYQMLVSLLSPYIHTGALLMTLTLAWMASRLRQARSPRHWLLAMALLVFGVVFSDALFVVWFVAPAISLSALYWWSTRNPSALFFASVVLASATVAWLLEFILRDKGSIESVHTSGSAALFFADAWSEMTAGNATLLFIMMALLALVIRSGWLAWRLLQRKSITDHQLVELFFGLVCMAAFAAPLLIGAYRGLALWRYFLVVFMIPPIWLTLGLVQFSRSHGIFPLNWSIAAVFLLAIPVAPMALPTLGSLVEGTRLQRCLHDLGRSEGFGDYWAAKSLIFASDRTLHIIQVQEAFLPNRINYRESWFRFRADTGEPLRPDFVIMQNIDPAAVIAAVGQPNEIATCGGKTVWLYDDPLPLPMPKRFSATAGKALILSANELPSAVGTIDAHRRIAVEGEHEAGALTYGPYIDFEPGLYRVDIHYSSSNENHRWDLVSQHGERLLAQGILEPSSGEPSVEIIELELRQMESGMEIRTFFSGDGQLTVDHIVFAPLGKH